MSIQVYHTGIVRNGKPYFDLFKLYNAELLQLEGKRFQMTIQKEHVPKTQAQRGYYFGGIIRKSCMSTESFGGWEFDEIDNYLRRSVRTRKKVVVNKEGEERTVDFVDADIEHYTKDEMAQYINDVLDYLALYHEIHPLEASKYKYGKYIQYKT